MGSRRVSFCFNVGGVDPRTVSRMWGETEEVSQVLKKESWEARGVEEEGRLEGLSVGFLEWRVRRRLLEREGRWIVDREDRRDVVPSEAIKEGGAEYSDPRNGFDWTVVDVVGRLCSAISKGGTS